MVIRKNALLILTLSSLAVPSFADDLLPKTGAEAQKPKSLEAFREDCPVVQVNWLVPETRQNMEGKPASAGVDFSVSDISVLSMTNNLPESTAPPATVVSREVMDELEGLLKTSREEPAPKNPAPVATVNPSRAIDAGESYLEELKGLGSQDNSWVLLNSEYAEVQSNEVEKAEPAYLSELHELQSRIQTLRPVVQKRAPRAVPVAVRRQERVGEERSLAALFPSVAELAIGTSSDSVRLPPDAGEAMDYLDGPSPSYYYTPVRYSVSRPNRMLYPFRNNPLYFEDPNLERCGISKGCLTEVSSVGLFMFNTAILPYRVAAQPPGECVKSLGDCPTCNEFDSTAALPPWSWRGVVAEAGVITGLVFIIP